MEVALTVRANMRLIKKKKKREKNEKKLGHEMSTWGYENLQHIHGTQNDHDHAQGFVNDHERVEKALSLLANFESLCRQKVKAKAEL